MSEVSTLPGLRPEIHGRPTPIAVIKKTGKEFIIQDVNQQAILGFGGNSEDLIGKNVNTLFENAQESSPLNWLYWNTLKAAKQFERGEPIKNFPRVSIKTKTGEVKTIQFAPKKNVDPETKETSFDIEITDITELVKNEQEAKALRASSESLASPLKLEELLDVIEQHIKNLVPHDTANIMLIKPDGTIELNKTWGYDGTTVTPGLNPANHISDRETLKTITETNKPLLINDTSIYPGWTDSPKEGKLKVLSYIGIPIHIKGVIIGFLNLNDKSRNAFNDRHLTTLQAFANQIGTAIEKSHLFKQLEQLSLTDPLTELHNRRSFNMQITKEVDRATRYKRPVSLLMIDIDYFKKYNDTHGHQAGDERLQKVAQVFKKNSRIVDTVARYGGEEFAIILPETNIDGALHDADNLVQEIRTLFSGQSVGATISIGVATFSKELGDMTPGDLIRRADQALYEAKHRGRDRVFDARNLDKNEVVESK